MLTPARIRTICGKVAKGVPQYAAAGSLGIPRRTFQNWLAAGRAEGAEGLYLDLAEGVDRALARFHESRVVQLHKVGSDDPRVIQWELERRFRDDWGEPDRGGVSVNVNLQTAPEWLELRDVILGALARHPDALADVLAAIGGGQVVSGDAVELAEIEAA